MARPQAMQMTEADVKNVAQKILAERFQKYRFEDVTVRDEQDFDGDHILRVVARVQEDVPTENLIDTLHAMRSALLQCR